MFIYQFPGKKAEVYDRTNPDWVPSIGLGGHRVTETPETPQLQRYNRAKGRTHRKLVLTPITEVQEPLSELASVTETCKSLEMSTQTEETSAYISGMENEIHLLRQENRLLRLSTVDRFSEEYFEDDDEKVNNMTGISTFATLMLLFQYVEPYMIDTQLMSKFQVLILTLMRLRLNASVTFLGYTFGIATPNVSRLFLNTIEVLYQRLYPCIYWPRREELELTMPYQFRQHFNRKCISIIDCFEVFIERPSNLEARMETWSSYKHHNTVKFLVGITPQGTVSFISKAWGGRVSDKYITEHCGYLNKIQAGDLILADRGFDISETVGSLCAQVNIPAFTRGKDQLSACDVETTRKVANVRIHVERVIGLVRQKYSFLSGTIPVTMLMNPDEENVTTIDKTAFVCCALINWNQSIVDFN
jgi:hypothetical protein